MSGCSVTIVPGDLFWCRPVPLVLSSIGGGFLFPRAPGLLLNVSADSLCDWLPYLSLGDLPLALEKKSSPGASLGCEEELCFYGRIPTVWACGET